MVLEMFPQFKISKRSGIDKVGCFETPFHVHSNILLFVKSQLWFTCIIHWTVLRGCALSTRTTLRHPWEKWKVCLLPPFLLFVLHRKIFFLYKENNEEQAGRVDKVYDVANRRIRGTFAAPFRPTKLQQDFHKAQRRAETHAGDLQGEGKTTRRMARSSEMEGKLRYPCRENSRGVSYLFPLFLGLVSVTPQFPPKKRKKSWQLAVYDQFYEVYVSLACRKVEVSNNHLKLRYTIEWRRRCLDSCKSSAVPERIT